MFRELSDLGGEVLAGADYVTFLRIVPSVSIRLDARLTTVSGNLFFIGENYSDLSHETTYR